VKNSERHSLARVTLRWMIRECFKTGTGIIFDARMLQHEIGLDMDEGIGPTAALPERLPPGVLRLRKPSGAELEGFDPRHIPADVISGLVSPFRRARGKLSSLRLRGSKKPKRIFEQPELVSLGEPQEELNDTLSPVVDQIKMHPVWNVIEWMPWLVKRQEVEEADDLRAYRWIWNRGEGREVYEEVMKRGVKVHRSVKTRMLACPMDGNSKPYLPKIRFMIGGEPRCLTRKEWLADKSEYFEWVD